MTEGLKSEMNEPVNANKEATEATMAKTSVEAKFELTWKLLVELEEKLGTVLLFDKPDEPAESEIEVPEEHSRIMNFLDSLTNKLANIIQRIDL